MAVWRLELKVCSRLPKASFMFQLVSFYGSGLFRPAMSRTLSEPIPLPGHPLWPKQPLLAKDNPSQFLKQVNFFFQVVV